VVGEPVGAGMDGGREVAARSEQHATTSQIDHA
jgi:hypothetical protein